MNSRARALDPAGVRSPGLAGDEVQVWQIDLQSPAGPGPRLADLLSGDERDRAARFHFDPDRQRFLAARGMLRVILARYLDLDPRQLQFRYGPNGKPYLPDTNLQFNIAHSRDRALVAVTRGRSIGVDLEHSAREIDIEAIARRFFAPAEAEALFRLTGPERRQGFFRGWTRKEAYLKARGEGITLGLDSFAVSLDADEPARLLTCRNDPQAVGRWSFWDVEVGPDYAAAVAAEGRGLRLTIRSPDGIEPGGPGSW